MKYRIRRDKNGVGGVGAYHAFKTNPPEHTLGPGWETVDELPREVIEAEKAMLEGPTEIEQLKARITDLEAAIKELQDAKR